MKKAENGKKKTGENVWKGEYLLQTNSKKRYIRVKAAPLSICWYDKMIRLTYL